MHRTSLPARALSSIRVVLEPDTIIARWAIQGRARNNWGDKLNPVLIRHLSGRSPVHESSVVRPLRRTVHLVVGSLLSRLQPNYIVWGSGFLSGAERVAAKPRDVCAVRGPLSRKKLLDGGAPCPEIYGDPAILYPLFYRPSVRLNYDVGIIRHYREQDFRLRYPDGVQVLDIDITGALGKVVDQALSCREIVSSSLHGLIIAHAYGIPATWIQLTDKPRGDGFKFRDHWAAMGCYDVEPIRLRPGDDIATVLGRAPSISAIDSKALISSCPFIDDRRKLALVSEVRHLFTRPGTAE